jgi:exonuclease VII small subunit
MNRYLLPKDDDGTGTAKRRIPIESPVGIYRIGNGTYTIVAETAEDLIDLGVKDSTVSRKTAGQPPVELAPTSRGISVRNHGSTNPITLRTKIKAKQLRIGESANVTDDCFVQVGINVELQATVEQHGGGESGSELAAAGRQNGVSPAAHAKTIADNLRNASQGSVTDARKVVDDMQTFVADHPIDDDRYEQICENLEQITARLESKAKGLHNTETLDPEWQAELQQLSDRIEQLYVRK